MNLTICIFRPFSSNEALLFVLFHFKLIMEISSLAAADEQINRIISVIALKSW